MPNTSASPPMHQTRRRSLSHELSDVGSRIGEALWIVAKTKRHQIRFTVITIALASPFIAALVAIEHHSATTHAGGSLFRKNFQDPMLLWQTLGVFLLDFSYGAGASAFKQNCIELKLPYFGTTQISKITAGIIIKIAGRILLIGLFMSQLELSRVSLLLLIQFSALLGSCIMYNAILLTHMPPAKRIMTWLLLALPSIALESSMFWMTTLFLVIASSAAGFLGSLLKTASGLLLVIIKLLLVKRIWLQFRMLMDNKAETAQDKTESEHAEKHSKVFADIERMDRSHALDTLKAERLQIPNFETVRVSSALKLPKIRSATALSSASISSVPENSSNAISNDCPDKQPGPPPRFEVSVIETQTTKTTTADANTKDSHSTHKSKSIRIQEDPQQITVTVEDKSSLPSDSKQSLLKDSHENVANLVSEIRVKGYWTFSALNVISWTILVSILLIDAANAGTHQVFIRCKIRQSFSEEEFFLSGSLYVLFNFLIRWYVNMKSDKRIKAAIHDPEIAHYIQSVSSQIEGKECEIWTNMSSTDTFFKPDAQRDYIAAQNILDAPSSTVAIILSVAIIYVATSASSPFLPFSEKCQMYFNLPLSTIMKRGLYLVGLTHLFDILSTIYEYYIWNVPYEKDLPSLKYPLIGYITNIAGYMFCLCGIMFCVRGVLPVWFDDHILVCTLSYT
ncbi:hypothetical protein HDV05_001050 [Chytridiales sp. JEL 0842]|nr:hypothetical protein HDV05_001050 [Chytridiales sp. JEL 0842]